jgi:hypothetical protein
MLLNLRSLDGLRGTSVRLQDTDEQEENQSHGDEANNNGA